MKAGAMAAAPWCLAAFFFCELIASALLVYYIIYPNTWPFSSNQISNIEPGRKYYDLCYKPPCIRKCCPERETFYKPPGQSLVCDPTNTTFSLDTLPFSGNVSSKSFWIIYGSDCSFKRAKLDASLDYDKHEIMANGSVMFLNNGKAIESFCIESNMQSPASVYLCLYPHPPVTSDDSSSLRWVLYPLGLTMSVACLIVTTAVYLLLHPLRNLHGRCLLCHVLSLIVAYSFLILFQINFLEMNVNHHTLCKVTAFVIQFSFLATFFWLNVMCFDIWWTFSGMRPLRGSVKQQKHKKFILYSVYAWGCPLLIFAVTIFMETSPMAPPDSYIKPKFGVDKCWFKDWKGTVLYFYLPIGILVMLNIAMFVTTALRLSAHKRETKVVLEGTDSRRNNYSKDRQRFNLYLKLFIVMGINWVMELVSFALGGPEHYWYVTDIGNTLQGVLIFIIFVCKRRVLYLLNQKLCPSWILVSSTSTSASTQVREDTSTSLVSLQKLSRTSQRE